MGFMNQQAELVEILRGGLRGIGSQLSRMSEKPECRVTALEGSSLMTGGVVEAAGIPTYVDTDDLSDYSAYGLTLTGWYAFARIAAPEGLAVVAATTVTGAAGYIATVDAEYVDVAVRFETAALSQTVTITWDAGGTSQDKFLFKADDLAIRNLDYRATFYVYDVSDFVTWQFAASTDDAFVENKKYFTQDGDVYTLAEVTAGAAARFYERSVSYALTTDETFQEGKTYYTESGGEYTAAEVTTGEAVTANTYYEQAITYSLTEDAAFADGKTYYAKSGDAYTEAEVTPLDPIVTYYNHSKVVFSGMSRNVTYNLAEIIDCPVEIVCPAIPEDGYGAWFEFQTRMDGTYSVTLTLPEGVKAGTTSTQPFGAGLNVIDLHYISVAGAKSWQLINTKTTLPTETTQEAG